MSAAILYSQCLGYNSRTSSSRHLMFDAIISVSGAVSCGAIVVRIHTRAAMKALKAVLKGIHAILSSLENRKKGE